MLAEFTERVTRPIRRPIEGIKSLLVGLPMGELRDLAAAPAALKNLAQLQLSFFNFRYILPVLLARDAGVFEALERTPLSIERLAERCEIHLEAARTLVRVLQSQGIVSEEDGKVALSDLAGRFLTPGSLTQRSSKSLLPVIDLLLNYATSFDQVARSLHTGETPPSLDVRGDDRTTDAILQAVNSHIAQAARELFATARLPEIRSAIVGSMGVSFSAELLRHYPDARITYGCLEHLVRRIPELREQYDVDPSQVDGTHAHTGEPADDQWGDEAYDLVFLTRKMILEPEEHVGEKFAKKALDVLEPGGAAVFWEAVHPDRGPSPLPLALETVFDLGMSPSAPLKTESSFAQMLGDIGYESVDYVSCLGGTTTFAIARKAG